MNLTAPEATQFDPAAADQMEKIISDLGRMYHERNEALQEVARAHHEALFLLAMAAEYKDDDTGVHIVRIGFLAEARVFLLANLKAYARLLRKAAPMHDIGKIGIPDSVLKKPGPLTPEERLIMNQHPAIGADILGKSRIALFRMATEIALTHHERWDGQGYPHQLAGQAIPLSGRIVAVADFYDALTMTASTALLSAKKKPSQCCKPRVARHSTRRSWIASCSTVPTCWHCAKRVTAQRTTFADLELGGQEVL